MRHLKLIAILSAITFLVAGAAQAANVFDMGGTRNADGSWNGLASLEFVTVGNPGNDAASALNTTRGHSYAYGCGAVDCVYQIGTFEITAAQYTVFLNAVAGVDTYGLYESSMWTSSYGCKIERYAGSGTVGDLYQYCVAADWANRPVNYVSFWDAARFVNWLHNGQPTGAQEPETTEDGAYIHVGNQAAFARQPDALYWIPSEDEWYKAAYYDPTQNGTGAYWLYPTRSNSVPNNPLLDPDLGNHATFWGSGGYPTIGDPYWRTEVGSHENSGSYCGTFDQGGNVYEWNETAVTSASRGFRGGSFGHIEGSLRACEWAIAQPTIAYDILGFRVASIPEPGSVTLLVCCAVAGLLWHVRRSSRAMIPSASPERTPGS